MKDAEAGKIPMPTKKYVQNDAYDNVAQAVYVSMEHLVCPHIKVCWLSVGHTQEDVDSRFGMIYKAPRSENI